MNLTRDTLALMDSYGDSKKPVWLTEVGCGAKDAEAEKAQATLLEDTLNLGAMSRGFERVFWFTLRDMAKDLLGPESSMGIFKYDGAPKPALRAFQQAAASATRPEAAK